MKKLCDIYDDKLYENYYDSTAACMKEALTEIVEKDGKMRDGRDYLAFGKKYGYRPFYKVSF